MRDARRHDENFIAKQSNSWLCGVCNVLHFVVCIAVIMYTSSFSKNGISINKVKGSSAARRGKHINLHQFSAANGELWPNCVTCLETNERPDGVDGVEGEIHQSKTGTIVQLCV